MNTSGDITRGDADLSNWRTAPHSRWAFHHVDGLMATATIASDAGAAFRFENETTSFAELRIPAGPHTDIGLDDFLSRTGTDGFVVVADGKLLHESYGNGTTAHTPHILMSASKSVVGLIAGILQDRGTLDLDAPVSTHVPEIATTAYRGATLRHLLDMRAGLLFDTEQTAAYAQATGWEPSTADTPSASLHRFFATTTAPLRPHGGAFSYVTANTDLLGWAIERATGRSFASLASDLLWKPMGAEDDAFVTLDREGAPRCTGGLCATTRDLARLGHLMTQDGRRGEESVIPASLIDDIANHGDHAAWRAGEFAPLFGTITMRYRSGWYVIDDDPKMLFAMGIHGQNLFVDLARRLVVAKVSSQALPLDPAAIRLTLAAVGAIRRFIGRPA